MNEDRGSEAGAPGAPGEPSPPEVAPSPPEVAPTPPEVAPTPPYVAPSPPYVAPSSALPGFTVEAAYVPPSLPRPRGVRAREMATRVVAGVAAWGRARFLERDPTFWAAVVPFALLAVVLFARWVTTNFIFDEQEALLANPYVNATAKLRFIDALHRDFWGLPPDHSIGSYRPIPNFLWRALWSLSKGRDGVFRQAFIHHIDNVFFHAINAAIITCVAFSWTKRRALAWMAGLIFVASAVLTEAVSGIVGIADVLGGMGALLALAALSLPAWAMPFAVFMAVTFGLFCKESALVCVPLVPFAALLVAPLTHPRRPARFTRAALSFLGAAAAFYLYVELRKRWFPSPLPKELADGLADDARWPQRVAHDFLVWFHQAPLPKDPLNNPLVDAEKPFRIAGALRVYWRGLVQLVYPTSLSGDYSFPQEPIPTTLVFPESVAGAAMMALPPLGSVVLWLVALVRERGARLEAARAGGGMAGDVVGALLRLTAVALLLVQPALAFLRFLHGEPGEDLFPASDHDAPLLLGPPILAALFLLVATARSWLAVRAPGGDPGLPRKCILGMLLMLAALVIFAEDLILLGPRGLGFIEHLRVWTHRPTIPDAPFWLAGVPLGILGLGLFVEGLPALAVPDPRRLGLSGVILVAFGITWVVVSYFPHSNIPVVLPTVRAERFWYFPAIGSTLVLAVFFSWLHELVTRAGEGDPDAPPRPWPTHRSAGAGLLVLLAVLVMVDTLVLRPRGFELTYRGLPFGLAAAAIATLVLAVIAWGMTPRERHGFVPAIFGVFIAFQGVQAYRHAMDYRSDVAFWRATKDAVPRSSKAHLNYSVMKGARGDLQTRLDESMIAMTLAPKWAMAHIYTGDTLCRMHRAPEAWKYYEEGFNLGPNDLSLIALALQCMYDEKELTLHEDALHSIASAHEGSWIAYLANDTLLNHEKNKGVDPKYRPRGYNDGPKE
jgi:hypothetical protein